MGFNSGFRGLKIYTMFKTCFTSYFMYLRVQLGDKVVFSIYIYIYIYVENYQTWME